MKATILISISTCLLSSFCSNAEEYNFERYKVIFDKDPFGTMSVPQDIPDVNPVVAPQNDWSKDYRISMLIENSDQSITLGLVNLRSNSGVTLTEGEEDPVEGIKFVSAEYKKGEATLEKGGEQKTIGSDDNQPSPVVAPSAKNKNASTGNVTKPTVTTSATSSYAERRLERQKRLAELRQKQEERVNQAPKYTGEELENHLKEYQMEVIRRGLPPLPVEVTPEMERQLQNEGVLPGPPAPQN